jgi:hypothetical protein
MMVRSFFIIIVFNKGKRMVIIVLYVFLESSVLCLAGGSDSSDW